MRTEHTHSLKQKMVRGRVLDCTNCSLAETCTKPVPGSYGRKTGGILIIGEAPGHSEDKANVPFVGQAGKLLQELTDMVDIKRQWLSYCNTVSCRPPNNRNPSKAEMSACANNLRMQVSAVRPHVIVPLGAVPLSRFRVDMKISWDRGRPFVDMERRAIILPSYHPSYVLRQRSAEDMLRGDLRQAKDRFLKYAKESFESAAYDWPEDCHRPNCKEDVDKYDYDGVAFCLNHWTEGKSYKPAREMTLEGTV